MDLLVKDKAFIVTGGAKGIGGATSELLSALGGIPIIVDRDEESSDAIVARIKKNGGRASSIAVDLTQSQSAAEAVTFAMTMCGRIDGIVNNAGVNDRVGLQHGNVDAFEASLRKNLVHYYVMAMHALPYLIKTAGSIVNVSSKTAETGQGGTSGYVASKGAINALTREWAVELLRYGIRVNCVIPAEVWTPLCEWFISQEKDPAKTKRETEKRIPLGNRFTTPEEIAWTIVFLLSGRSSHTTGQLIHVDGGCTHLDRMLHIQ
jgi:L-fucose dehydrogenase